jgi:hypothetical protein
VWGTWFDRDEPGRTFALKAPVDAAAIGRTDVSFGGSTLTATGCDGDLEGSGHSLRWHLSFGQGWRPEEFVPPWLGPVARLRGSGLVLPQPATTVTGAVEIDGAMVELQRVPAAQGHLWAGEWPSWIWARCSAFAEDPAASVDLLDLEGPRGLRLPLFVLRFRGEVHRFAELPWMAFSRSRPALPAWHFAASGARIAIDGVVRALPDQMVQVPYGEHLHCANTEIASMEVRVSARAFVGASWRPEATLTSKCGASLEFCGRTPDPRVEKRLVAAVAGQKEGRAPGSVAF